MESSREAFVRAGWSEVEASRPDEEVLALRMLEGGSLEGRQARERAVTLQLQSAVLGDELVPAAARWVRHPQAGERVREAALEALGRSRAESAQEELARLWQEGRGDLSLHSRRRVLELLHAGSRVADARTQVLLQVLREDGASEADRDQAAYSLALGAALKVELERELLRALPEGPARVRFLKRLEQIRTSAVPPAAQP